VAGLRHPELTVTKLKLDLSGGMWSRLLGVDSGKVSYQVTNAGNVILAPEATGEVTTRTSTITLPDHLLGETLPGSTAVLADPVEGLRWGSLIGRVQVRPRRPAPAPSPQRARGGGADRRGARADRGVTPAVRTGAVRPSRAGSAARAVRAAGPVPAGG
jgi:hypothetical protein